MDVTEMVARQRRFFRSGATQPVEFRRAQLRSLSDAMQARETALLDALQLDLRKSPHQAYASELGLVLAELEHAHRHLPAWMKARRRRTPWISWPARGWVRPEARGVALIIGPWNYPLQLLLAPLVGALAAGNCAVLKPSEFAPHTATAISQLLGDTFPPDYVAVAPGEREMAEALRSEKFDAIFFTGSTAVGRVVMAAAANHLTPVTLELGGKCPCLVCADAPLDLTARRIVWGKFLNAGQTCVAPDFVLADHRIHDRLVSALAQAIQDFYGEDPQRSPDYGRIVNRRHFDRLTGYLDSGQIAHGGQRDAAGLYLAPTLLTGVSWEIPVMREEIFGPHLPFGGFGESGLGAYHGQASFDCFTHYRTVLRRSLAYDARFRYPPTRLALATLKRAFRFLVNK